MRRWGPNAGNRALEKHVAKDIAAMLTELLHWKSCHVAQCARCVPIDGATEAERMFGERHKDLSSEDRREYKRVTSRRAYLKRKSRTFAATSAATSLAREELDPQQ